MRLRRFIDDSITVSADVTPAGWSYPGRRHPEHILAIEEIVRSGLPCKSFSIGVDGIRVESLLEANSTASEISAAIDCVRGQIVALQIGWSEELRREMAEAG